MDENAHVQADGVLAFLDMNTFDAQVESATAALEVAQAKQSAAQAEVSSAGAAVAQANVDVAGAEVLVKTAQDALARTKNVIVDAGRQIQLNNAHDFATRAQQQQQQADAQAADAAVQIDQAQASLDLAKLDRQYAIIVAPPSGRVAQRSAQVGLYVTPGSPLLTIVPDDAYVTAHFKETQLADMKLGQSVRVDIDAYPGVGSMSPSTRSSPAPAAPSPGFRRRTRRGATSRSCSACR